MLKNLITAFAALVLIFFVCTYPDKVVELVQAFIDAAYKMASALGHLNTHTPDSK